MADWVFGNELSAIIRKVLNFSAAIEYLHLIAAFLCTFAGLTFPAEEENRNWELGTSNCH